MKAFKHFNLLLIFAGLSVFSYGQKYTGLTALTSTGATPTSLFDGNYSAGWQDPTASPTTWVTVDLGSIKTVNSVKIYWETANAKDYDLLISSDNSTWTTVASQRNMAPGIRSDYITGLNTTCRYVKMQGITLNTVWGYNIFEFEIYDAFTPAVTSLTVTPTNTSIVLSATQQFAVNGLDQALNPITLTNATTWSVDGTGTTVNVNGLFSSTQKGFYTVTATNTGITKTATINVLPTNTNLSYVTGVSATATASSGTASAAFDNNGGTRWESTASDPQWIEVDLGGNKTITDFIISWETANAKDYIIQTSTDNTNWSTVVTKTNMPAGTRTDRIYDVNYIGRYIRLTGTARTTNYGYSIWEFQIYGSSLITPNLTFATPTSVTKNFGDAAFSNTASSSNSSGAITYSSGDTGVATVDANTGQVTIVSAGTAVITATIAANGSYSSGSTTYTLTVNGVVPNLTFATPTSITKNYGDAAFTNAASSSNSSGTITYSSGNTDVATVNSSTGEVTIVAAGTAVITANIGSYLSFTSTTASYTLTITGVAPNFSFATSGTINKKMGDAAFSNTASSSNSAGTISYSCDNTGVATIDASTGQVTIVGIGTAIITATIAANGSYTSQTATYNLVVKYPIGSIKGTGVPLYTQGTAGGDVTKPVNTDYEVLDYKVVTENGKSWVYNKFTGTSALDLTAGWTSQIRYWTSGNAKTENNLTSRNATTKVVTGTATTTIPNPVKISFFQSLNPGGWSETLLTDYNPTTDNSPVSGDVTAPTVTACDVLTTETTATLTISGSDNSGDLFYHIEDAVHSIDEFAFEGIFTLSGLTIGTTYNLSITPIDFSGNEGSAFSKQFTCGSNVNISSSIATSAIPTCTTCNFTIANGAELTVDNPTTLQNITVAAGGRITVQSGQTLTAGTIALNSDATATATFIDKGTASITTANVQQYLTSGRNWYISSPVSTATTGALSSTASVVEYNETTGIWVHDTGTLNPLKGYISTSTTTTGTVTFSGTLNTGNQTTDVGGQPTLTRTGTTAQAGFNLVGNPYPSYVDWNAATKTNLETTYWYRTKTAPVSGLTSYVFDTFNATGGQHTNLGATTVSNLIPPMQAFWVRVANGFTSGTLAFTNAMRSHADVAGNIMKAPSMAKSQQQVLRLQVSNGINKDETILYSDPNASNGFDNYDSPKMSNDNASVPEIYTSVGNEQLVINGMNSLPLNIEIPLGFTTKTSNAFTIKASELNNLDSTIRVILKDKQNLSNPEQDITDGSAYSFSSDATSSDNRFSIIFKTTSSATGIANPENNAMNLQVYKNLENHIVIKLSESQNGIITIWNTVGQSIFNTKLTGTTTVINKSFGSGVYFIKIEIAGEVTTKKIII
jgi:hypothetical protein